LAKLISFKTRRTLGGQDTEENDDFIKKNGRYIGVLLKDDAEYLRLLQERLTALQQQINEMVEAFDTQYRYYLQDVESIFLHLKIPPETFNPEKEKLYIGEDGHLWVVDKKEGE
jgi:hypothetical protein